MREPFVSVIIPIYNVETYISDCIISVLGQNYPNYEIILLNDGSTDSSQSVCEEYVKLDDRVKLYNKSNGGLSSARNYGIDKAKGEYVIFIDSDDYWTDSNALGHLINIAEETNADVVRGEYKEVDDVGNDLYIPTIYDELHQLEHKLLDNYVFVKEILCRGHFSWLFLIRKATLGNCRFDTELKFQEDIEFDIRFFSKPQRCVYTSFRFYAYRKRANSLITTAKISNLMYSFHLSLIWHNYAQRITDEDLKKVYVYNSIMMYYWTLDSITLEPYFHKRKEIIMKMDLRKFQQNVYRWSMNSGERYPIVIKFSPLIGIWLLKTKHIIGQLIKKVMR